MTESEIREIERQLLCGMKARRTHILTSDDVTQWAVRVWDKHGGRVGRQAFANMMAYAWENGRRCAETDMVTKIVAKALMMSSMGGIKECENL